MRQGDVLIIVLDCKGGNSSEAKSIIEWGPEVPNSQTIYLQITITT